MAADQFVIDPRPPARAFVLAAALSVTGAVLAVLPLEGALRWVLVVLGILLIAAAGLLMGLAVASMRRQRVVVVLDDDGFRVDSPTGVRSGAWAEVTRVTAAPGRITLHQGETERVHLVAAAGKLPQFDAIAHAISQRLDDDRGYQIWQG